MTNANTAQLSEAGVSIWLDDLSRERLEGGSLTELIESLNVVGVTTNPTIFAGALANGEAYEPQIRSLAAQGASVDEAIFELTTADVQRACDVLAEVHQQTGGRDGYVSIEVSPVLAHDTDATIEEARRLWKQINRPNLMIKIPATPEGLPAIAQVIGEGINVNVTLIFALDVCRSVLNAYQTGLERAHEAGLDLSKIHSVASVFVSRIDVAVNALIDKSETCDAALRSKAALANAVLAYEVFREGAESERAHLLAAQGANAQRPLWASTGVKDASLPDTLYVTELVARGCVNTMPQKTLDALADHGEVHGDTLTGNAHEANQVLDRLAESGIELVEVYRTLEREGVEKFVASWEELRETVRQALDHAKGA